MQWHLSPSLLHVSPFHNINLIIIECASLSIQYMWTLPDSWITSHDGYNSLKSIGAICLIQLYQSFNVCLLKFRSLTPPPPQAKWESYCFCTINLVFFLSCVISPCICPKKISEIWSHRTLNSYGMVNPHA